MSNKYFNRQIVKMIAIYQKSVSPFIGPCCRFTPSCSEYGKQAFLKYGFFYAAFLTCKRVFKCHPFHPGGIDELP